MILFVCLFVVCFSLVSAINPEGPIYAICHTLGENNYCEDFETNFIWSNISDTGIIYFQVFQDNESYDVKLFDFERGPLDSNEDPIALDPLSPLDESGIARFSISGVGDYIIVLENKGPECDSILNYNYSNEDENSLFPSDEEINICLRYIDFSVYEDSDEFNNFISGYDLALDSLTESNLETDSFSYSSPIFREISFAEIPLGPFVPSLINREITPFPPSFGSFFMNSPPINYLVRTSDLFSD